MTELLNMGMRIRHFRILRGMTQKALGIAVGFPQYSADVRIAQYDGAILKKWTAKSERWYNNKKRRERHGKHQVYRGIQAKHSKLV